MSEARRNRAVASTIVVVTWRGAGHVYACLDALAAQTRPHRVLVVDNASQDGTDRLLAQHPSAPEVLRLPSNRGYAGALAAATSRIDTPFMAWLNDDAEPEPGWLAALEDTLRDDPAAAAVGSRMVGSAGTVQSYGVCLTADGHGADLISPPNPVFPAGTRQATEVFGFCGGAALLRTVALRAIGGVPGEYFCYYEDTDVSWRLRLAGWRVLASPAGVGHLHGASTGIGSARFHRWNERNRLLTLLRCAPAQVATGELARFVTITALLPIRRVRSAPQAPNLTAALRTRVLVELVRMLPETLRARRRITRLATHPRSATWRRWAGS